MIAQRRADAAPVVRGAAERLPFPDGSFDVALAVLTVHHWGDRAAGVAELRRVARRQVVLTYDPAAVEPFWLVRDYLPELVAFERSRVPSLHDLRRRLGATEVRRVPVPRDMRDGVLAVHWARPQAYLDPRVRASASGLVQADQGLVERRMDLLREHLADGTWAQRNAELADLAAYDAGYRLVIGGRPG